MGNIKAILNGLFEVKRAIEQIKVSGTTDCAFIIACCNTLDSVMIKIAKMEEAEDET